MTVYLGVAMVWFGGFSIGWVARSWLLYRKDARAMEAARYRHPSYTPLRHWKLVEK